jgi:hypothetical protein
MTKIDPELQAQVDAQLMEQGVFSALELLINSGRLLYSDYEAWRRREVELLDDVLMGSQEKIRAQLESAAAYARSVKLVEQAQEFDPWPVDGQPPSGRALRISSDAQLQRLIASRYLPAQSVPQMDLFFDNPVVTISNGIVRALGGRNSAEAQRQLDRLYALAPNHADLGAFDRLLTALGHLDQPVADARAELEFLLAITPTAKRLLGSQSRDLLTPLWHGLARALEGGAFTGQEPNLHRSFALSQAQDWAGVSQCVLSEPGWWLHAQLCLRLAQSSFYRQRRAEALTGWCHLCWRHPEHAAEALDKRLQPDASVTALWERFLESEEDAAEPSLDAADFPAWLLLHEPGLAQQLAEDLPTDTTRGEEHYRCVHRWIRARRAARSDEETALRRQLQASQPALFRYLLRRATSL